MSVEAIKEEVETYNEHYLDEDCVILGEYVRRVTPGKLLEIGSGATTITIVKALKAIAEEFHQECCDPNQFVSVDIDKRRLEILSKSLDAMHPLGVGLMCDNSLHYITQFCIRHTYDFIFIDSSHTLEQTVLELSFTVPLLKPTGVIFMHDTKLSSVMQAIYVVLENNPKLQFFEYNTHYGLGELRFKCE